jgi:hypothetical protein
MRDHDQHARGYPDQGDDAEDDADHRKRPDIPPDLLGVPVPGLLGWLSPGRPCRLGPG